MSKYTEKILVCGDIEGRFRQLFKRVNTVIEKSGPFSMLICVGEFFGNNDAEWTPYKTGACKVPIPTYILGPLKPELKSKYQDIRGCEIVENVIYLGPSGIYPCSSGLRIAYLSGLEANDDSKASGDIKFNESSIKSLTLEATNKPVIDILITSQWPNAVCNYVKSPEGINVEDVGSKLVSHLAYKLLPRYHFSALHGVHYERLPYRNHQVLVEPAKQVTRFIAVAKVGNTEKRKWIYAFNIIPSVHIDHGELIAQPADVTQRPYDEINTKIKDKQSGSSAGAQFFYDMNITQENKQHGKRKRENGNSEMKRPPPKPTGPCWFCLASPEVEKHLIVSVGTYSYLALAKGPLVHDHLLILPIAHFQSTLDLDHECREEIEQFKSRLRKMFASMKKRVVFFERNYKSHHLQIQVIPVPADVAFQVKETFLDYAGESTIDLEEIPKHSDIVQIAHIGSPYFYLELPDGEKLYHRIRKGFSLQFGREVLASPQLLNVTDRIDWRECKMSKDEEIKQKEIIREEFKAYDFTLDSDEDD